MSRMEVRCFGEFAVSVDGRPLHRWRAGKARHLFQYLLLHRDRWISRQRLHEVLWPGNDRAVEGSSLKVAVHAVRRAVAEATPDGEDPPVVVHQSAGEYMLATEDFWSDAEEFEAAAAAARVLDPAQARPHWARLVELYRGDFLPGEDVDWAVEHREWCRGLTLHGLDQLVEQGRQDGRVADVMAGCKRALEIDPFREVTYRTLMVVHARRGEPARVRDWYELCAGRLRRELDVEPTDRTRRVLEAALRPAPPNARPSTRAAA